MRAGPYPFLDALAETCNVAHSARAAGCARKTAYQAYRREPAFAAAWVEALGQGYHRLEEKLLAHALAAVSGSAEPFEDLVAPEDEGALTNGPGEGVVLGKSPFTDARLALALLNRHQRSVAGGRMASVKVLQEVTPEAVDAALCKQLDALARSRRGRP